MAPGFRMGRWITRTVLFTTGVMLAFNVGGAQTQLEVLATRNAIVIALTKWLHNHAPAALYDFEQDLLLYFGFSPYAVLSGVLAGLIWSWPKPLEGVLFFAASAACFNALLIRYFAIAESLAWYHCLDFVLSQFALIPIFVLSANLGNAMRTKRKFRFTLQDLLLGSTLIGILLTAIMTRWFLAVPIAIFFSVSWLAWRTFPQSRRLAA